MPSRKRAVSRKRSSSNQSRYSEHQTTSTSASTPSVDINDASLVGEEKPTRRTRSSLGGASCWVVLAAGVLLRVGLVLFGIYVDATYDYKYTDIDYEVFTDGAREMYHGRSPYDRATYRYTPLLAFMMIPNVAVHSAFGKFVFVVVDLCIMLLLWKIMRIRGVQSPDIVKSMTVFLFHPVVANVTTRGSADGIVTMLVLAVLYLLLRGRVWVAAICYGVAVHFKIYPIIYALPLVLFLDDDYEHFYAGVVLTGRKVHRKSLMERVMRLLRSFFSWRRVAFGLLSGITFLLLQLMFYELYGWTFLYEGYLHHLVRTDHRHNFSAYFYDIYLRYDLPSRTGMGLLTFFPQFGSTLVVGLCFYKDISVCLLLQTMVFVAFNKVFTAQYLVWHLALLPLALPANKMRIHHWCVLGVLWLLTHIHWIVWAGKLENEGISTFKELWIAGLLYFCSNLAQILAIMRYQNWKPVISNGHIAPYTVPNLGDKAYK
eukprot:gb/GECG01010188.1/.p1 GENE.gb/GECG01010188.1/~~gb/GECG01010188.1/.p1  ORF type:complete len:486 (+),score=15.69 gb/GECG01010188.1/:1-1458(+)